MRRIAIAFLVFLAALFVWMLRSPSEVSESAGQKEFARILNEEIHTSYPQLSESKFKIDSIASDFTYLETQFTPRSFFFSSRLEYQIMLNPGLMQHEVPPEGLRGIVAHELAHADYFHRHNRLVLLGLARLIFPSFRARFERAADLEAIALGYGQGLKVFRLWLYENVPANQVWEKKRDYFSPEEIDAIERARARQPDLILILQRCVPLDLKEVQHELADAAHACPAASH